MTLVSIDIKYCRVLLDLGLARKLVLRGERIWGISRILPSINSYNKLFAGYGHS